MAERTRGFRSDRATLLTGRGTWQAIHRAAPWIAVAVMFVLVNSTSFGYPTLYVE